MNSKSPAVVQRHEQPYVGIHQNVTMAELAGVADRIPELLRWLDERSIRPAGPPFFRYNLIDMQARLSVEVGVPVANPLTGDDDVRGGVLPAGRYLTDIHVGPPNTIVDAVRDLLEWADDRKLSWDVEETPFGERWGCRIESYLTDPQLEPDLTKWRTELAFRLAD
jgi:effector-binding domain-containing protein